MVHHLLVLALIFSLAPTIHAQVPMDSAWSDAIIFEHLPDLAFRWRALEKFRSGDMTFIEMEFTRTTETPVRFDYIIQTDKDEKIYGRIILDKFNKSIFGGYFIGTGIIDLALMDIDTVVQSDLDGQ